MFEYLQTIPTETVLLRCVIVIAFIRLLKRSSNILGDKPYPYGKTSLTNDIYLR